MKKQRLSGLRTSTSMSETLWCLFVGLTFLMVLMSSCSDGGKEKPTDIQIQKKDLYAAANIHEDYSSIDLRSSMKMDDDEVRVFIVPTALQVSSVLQYNNVPYGPDYLIDIRDLSPLSTEFYNSLTLGMLIIDAGYCVINDDGQKALNYVKHIGSLINILQINFNGSENLMSRFTDNLHNQDSLINLINDTYNGSNDYFKQSGREGIGLLILTGCFVESAYLNGKLGKNNEDFTGFLVQQKFMLQNLSQFLTYYTGKSQLINQLLLATYPLRSQFGEVDAGFNENSHQPWELRKPLEKSFLKEVSKYSGEIRNCIIEGDIYACSKKVMVAEKE